MFIIYYPVVNFPLQLFLRQARRAGYLPINFLNHLTVELRLALGCWSSAPNMWKRPLLTYGAGTQACRNNALDHESLKFLKENDWQALCSKHTCKRIDWLRNIIEPISSKTSLLEFITSNCLKSKYHSADIENTCVGNFSNDPSTNNSFIILSNYGQASNPCYRFTVSTLDGPSNEL